MYYIVTCDLIQSKKVENRMEVQQEIKSVLNSVNTQYSKQILCPFVIVWGDSFQGALKSLKGFYEIIETLEELIPVDFRCGIGIGKISTQYSDNVLEMDGPAFYHSKSALETAEKDHRSIWLQSGNPHFDRMVNTVLILLYTLKMRWTAHQKEIITLRREGQKYEEIGKQKNISKQAVNKALKTARWADASFAIHTLNEVTNHFFEQMEISE
jgi:hypothetical protein